MGWKGCGHPVVTLGLKVSHGGSAEMWRKKNTGLITEVRYSVFTTKCSLKRWVLGVISLAEAREAEACPGDLSPPVLPSRDMGRAAGIKVLPIPCSGCLGGWTACQAACRALIPFSGGSGNPAAAHESCEIQPCVGTGCT